MHANPQWGDTRTLSTGKVIQYDPAQWQGGIIVADGRWFRVLDIGYSDNLFSIGWGDSVRWVDTGAILPSPAGLTLAERWELICGLCGPVAPIDRIVTCHGLRICFADRIGADVDDDAFALARGNPTALRGLANRLEEIQAWLQEARNGDWY